MQRYALETASTLLRSDYSHVLDAMDDVLAKVDLIMRARQLGVPIISSMLAGNRLSAAHFRWPTYLDQRLPVGPKSPVQSMMLALPLGLRCFFTGAALNLHTEHGS